MGADTFGGSTAEAGSTDDTAGSIAFSFNRELVSSESWEMGEDMIRPLVWGRTLLLVWFRGG
jgi:hypothetical protein